MKFILQMTIVITLCVVESEPAEAVTDEQGEIPGGTSTELCGGSQPNLHRRGGSR